MEGFEVKNGVAVFPEGIKEIPADAFKGNADVQTVVCPQGVKSIGDNAFNGCKKLQSVELPEGLICIGKDVFGDCKKLTSINIPSSVEQIGRGAFKGTAIENLDLPESLQQLNEFTFFDCKKLQTVRMSKATPIVGCWAFPTSKTFKLIYTDGTEVSGKSINNADSYKTFYYIPFNRFGLDGGKALKESYYSDAEEYTADQEAFEEDVTNEIQKFYESNRGKLDKVAVQGIDFTKGGIYVEDFENNLYAVVLAGAYRIILVRYE